MLFQIVITASLIFSFSFYKGVISGALVLIQSPKVFNLDHFQSESVVSAAVFGAIVGAGCGSISNHLFGRKVVILASSFLFVLGSLLMGAAESFHTLLAGRLVVGIGIGLSSMTVPLYISEVSPPAIRGRLVSFNTLLVTGGQFFACVLAAFLSKDPHGWRLMLGIAAIPAAIQFFGFLLLPESPRYLINAKRKTEAWEALVKIRGHCDIEVEFNHIEAEVERSEKKNLNIWEELKSQVVKRALFFGCFLQALQQFCGINTVMYYGATIIQMAGFKDDSTAIWMSAIVSFSNFIFTFVGIYLVDRTGRRKLTLASLAGVIVSLFALGASFYAASRLSTPVIGVGSCQTASTCFDCVAMNHCGLCLETNKWRIGHSIHNLCFEGNTSISLGGSCPRDQWYFNSCPNESDASGYFILLALFMYLAFFASGMGCMPWTINAEIYPLHVRSFAISMSTAVNWMSNLIVSFTFLSIIDTLAPYGAFWLYAILAICGFIYLYQTLPETKGLELEEIQKIFHTKLSIRQKKKKKYQQLEKENDN
jgi:SP family myo-inositol transporter-like MFS transporter 13